MVRVYQVVAFWLGMCPRLPIFGRSLYRGDGHNRAFNRALSRSPIGTGIGKGLPALQADSIGGLEMQRYRPFPIDEHIRGVSLYKDEPCSPTRGSAGASTWKTQGRRSSLHLREETRPSPTSGDLMSRATPKSWPSPPMAPTSSCLRSMLPHLRSGRSSITSTHSIRRTSPARIRGSGMGRTARGNYHMPWGVSYGHTGGRIAVPLVQSPKQLLFPLLFRQQQ